MKALTVCQPYAGYIAAGEKRVENRTWRTEYRGDLAIHASRSRNGYRGVRPPPDTVFGVVVCVVRLVACVEYATPFRYWCHKYGYEYLLEEAYFKHVCGPWCWILDDIRPLSTPIPATGRRRLFTLPALAEFDIERQLT